MIHVRSVKSCLEKKKKIIVHDVYEQVEQSHTKKKTTIIINTEDSCHQQRLVPMNSTSSHTYLIFSSIIHDTEIIHKRILFFVDWDTDL